MSKTPVLPDPMTPPDCDLRGLGYMPLDVVRLVDSDLFALSTGDEFKCALTLWCKSWLQVPAASLPDDDRILAHLSSAGMSWQIVRDMALRGWVKCSDGRLYHPVVAEKALTAWKQRLMQRGKANKRWEKKPNDDTTPNGGNAAAPPAEHAAASLNGAAGHAAASELNAAAFQNDATAHARAIPLHMQVKEKESKKETAANLVQEQTPREIESRVPVHDKTSSGEIAVDSRPEPVIPHDIRLMPRRSDPEGQWRWMGAKHEDEMIGVRFEKMTMRNGSQLRAVSELVCQAALIHDENWRGDWWTVAAWLDAGIDPINTIIPAIRSATSWDGFVTKDRLAWFDKRVREWHVSPRRVKAA